MQKQACPDTLESYKNYSSGQNYFEGAEGMGNEVSVLYVAGAVLLQHLMRLSGIGNQFGGLGMNVGALTKQTLPPVSVLDVCCGPGNLPNYLSLLIPKLQVTGLDNSQVFIDTAKEKFQDLGWNFVCDDARNFQLGRKFSFITGSSAYHHIEDEFKVTFLINLLEHLEEGGRIIICDNFIPPYSNAAERIDSVNKYYGQIKDYYRSGHGSQSAIQAIDGSHKRDLAISNEYKVSFGIFVDHIQNAGLEIENKIAIWQPTEFAEYSAGSYVTTLKKRRSLTC